MLCQLKLSLENETDHINPSTLPAINLQMNHLFIVLISLTFFIAKSCPGQTTFPDSIPFGNTETTSRLKGTRVFLKIPASYKVRDKAIGYQDFIKDSMTGLQVVENIFDNFYQLKNEVVKDLGKKINGGTGTSKTVKIGSYDGIYYTGPFKMPEQKSVLLIFGDSSFAVMIYGGFQSTDKVSEIELNTILKSTGYKKSWILNPLELPGIQFEEGITQFVKWVNSQDVQENNYSESIKELKERGLFK